MSQTLQTTVSVLCSSLAKLNTGNKGSTGALQHVLSIESDAPAFESAQSKESSVIVQAVGADDIEMKFSDAAIEMAATSAILASDPEQAYGADITVAKSTENYEAIGTIDPFNSISEFMPAIETYIGNDPEKMKVYSQVYNLLVSNDISEFHDTMYTTVHVDPSEAGVKQTVTLPYVQPDVVRGVDGKDPGFKLRSLVSAVYDSSIIDTNQNLITPVFRAGKNEDMFVSSDYVAPSQTTNSAGETFTTAPLAVGKTIEFLSLGSTDAMLASGSLDSSDVLDEEMRVENIYLGDKADLAAGAKIGLDVSLDPTATFSASRKGAAQVMNLHMVAKNIALDGSKNSVAEGNTGQLDGTKLPGDLELINTNNWKAWINVTMTGEVDMETALGVIHAVKVELTAITDNTGALVDPADADYVLFAAALAPLSVVSYDAEMYSANANLRNRGPLAVSRTFCEETIIHYRSPVTIIRPRNSNKTVDDLTNLIQLAKINKINDGIDALHKASRYLAAYANGPKTDDTPVPDVFGVGRYYLKPTHIKAEVDVNLAIASIKSHQREMDSTSALFSIVRRIVTDLYVDSQFGGAHKEVIGSTGKVTAKIFTDYRLATLLNSFKNNDETFQYKFVAHPNTDMSNKMIIMLSGGDNSGGEPHPLTSGFIGSTPTAVINADIPRKNQVSRELLVIPRYRHVVNNPVMAEITFTNIDKAYVDAGVTIV